MSQTDKPSPTPFPLTRWTLIRRVQKGGGQEATKALDEICREYWYPIYAFARRQGFPRQDAEDVTQIFFQRLIASETIQAAQQEKGRMRTFMLSLLKKVISNRLRDAATEKRGGSPAATISFEDMQAEERYLREASEVHDADAFFDRAWAEGVLGAAEKKLRDDYVSADNGSAYDQLRGFLPLGENATPYASAAKKLGINEGTLRLQVHRMRKRYAKLIEAEIAQTVDNASEVKAELEYLMTVVGQ